MMEPILNSPSFSAEKSGKTLHLLKSGSKPIQPRSQRKKIEILGTLAQYNDSKKKPAPSMPQQPPRPSGLLQEKPPSSVQSQITDTIMMAPQPNAPVPPKEDIRKKK